MNFEQLPILIILVLAVIGHNTSVSIAAAFLLLVKLLGFHSWFPIIEEKGLSIGVTVLTIAVLTPLVTGKISLTDMGAAFKTWPGIISILSGIFVAWAAGRGLFLISDTPQIVSSLVIGTMIGVCFLKGIAVGPLIAGGLVSLAMALFNKLS